MCTRSVLQWLKETVLLIWENWITLLSCQEFDDVATVTSAQINMKLMTRDELWSRHFEIVFLQVCGFTFWQNQLVCAFRRFVITNWFNLSLCLWLKILSCAAALRVCLS